MFPDYVYFVYVIVSVLYGNPPCACLTCIRQLSSTDLALFLPSRRVYHRFGSDVMNIYAPNLVP